MKHKYLMIFFSIIAALFATVFLPIAHSDWLFISNVTENKNDDIVIEKEDNLKECCYIYEQTSGIIKKFQRVNTDKKYARIDKAVNDANALAANGNKFFVRVISTADNASKTITTIKNSFTINNNVYLDLPYGSANNGINSEILDDSTDAGKPSFADDNVNNALNNRFSRVVLDKDVTITVNSGGFIRIGGQIGVGASSAAVSSHTSGKYSEIIMREGSKIINNGNLECYGYIRSESNTYQDPSRKPEIISGNNSITRIPFVVYGWPGGTNMSARIINGYTFPFVDFEFCNLATKSTFLYGSKIICRIVLGLPIVKPISNELTVLSNDKENIESLFKMEPNSKVVMDYEYPASDIVTSGNQKIYLTTGKGKTKYQLFGNTSLNNLNIDTGISQIGSIGTASMLLPIGRKMHIDVMPNSRCNVNVQIKMLPGSVLNIHQKATININHNLVVLTTFGGGHPNQPNYANLPQAILINNGNLNINGCKMSKLTGRSSFGGLILSNTPNAQITMNSNVIPVIGNHEGKGKTKLDSQLGFVASYLPEESQTEIAECASYSIDSTGKVVIDENSKVFLENGCNYSFSNGWNKTNGQNMKVGQDYFKITFDTKLNDANTDDNLIHERRGHHIAEYDYAYNKSVQVFVADDASGKNEKCVSDKGYSAGAYVKKDCYYKVVTFADGKRYDLKMTLNGQPLAINAYHKIPNQNITLRLPCVN